ncbi:unannotated protein [freshwater metagenome]|uniref:Unannotated protein n=1 Tax=freshwater metagenome TaxID=449393 RepID=A0A6J6GEZ0_9ZZZZ
MTLIGISTCNLEFGASVKSGIGVAITLPFNGVTTSFTFNSTSKSFTSVTGIFSRSEVTRYLPTIKRNLFSKRRKSEL